MVADFNLTLVVSAALSALAALLHVGTIIAGPSWYRLFGAGERFIRAAEAGRRFPAVVTAGIAGVLMVWAAYALAGAGVIEPLPLQRLALCAITLVYLARGVAGPFVLQGTGRSQAFIFVSSAICLGIGLVHLVGLVQVWGRL